MSLAISSPTAALLLNLTIIGTALYIALLLFLRLTRRLHPRLRYAFAVLAFIAAAVLPFIDFRSRISASPAPPLPLAEVPVVNVPFGGALPIIWIAVAALLIARDLQGYRALRARMLAWVVADEATMERLRWPRHVSLLVSDDDGPFVTGWFRQTVVVPAEVSPEVARHELAHAQWHDPLTHALLRLVRAALWMSAPLWLLERVVRREREAAADHAAVVCESAPHDVASLRYAELLLAAARSSSREDLGAVTPFGGSSELAERVARVLETPAELPARRLFAALALVTVTLAAIPHLPTATFVRASMASVSSTLRSIEPRVAAMVPEAPLTKAAERTTSAAPPPVAAQEQAAVADDRWHGEESAAHEERVRRRSALLALRFERENQESLNRAAAEAADRALAPRADEIRRAAIEAAHRTLEPRMDEIHRVAADAAHRSVAPYMDDLNRAANVAAARALGQN